MGKQNGIRHILTQHKVIPVVTFSDINQIDPVVEQLLSKEINVLKSPCEMRIVEGQFLLSRINLLIKWLLE